MASWVNNVSGRAQRGRSALLHGLTLVNIVNRSRPRMTGCRKSTRGTATDTVSVTETVTLTLAVSSVTVTLFGSDSQCQSLSVINVCTP